MKYRYSKYITIGERGPDGKRKRKRFYGNTKLELEDNIRRYLLKTERESRVSGVSFGEYAKLWMSAYKSGRSIRTQEMYERAISKCSQIEKKEMGAITKTDCQMVIQGVWEHPRTAQIVNLTLRQIMETAVADGIITSSPAVRLTLPKRKEQGRRLLTETEMEAAKNAELSEMDRMFLNLLIVFGLRPGEALALSKSDFDLDTNVLHINKAVEMPDGGESRIKGTKTDATRDIPIPKGFGDLISAYKIPNKASFLISRENGKLSNKNSYRRLKERILKAINRELGGSSELDMLDGMTMYSFRHYRATQLYYLTQKGKLSTKKAAYLMGHSEQVFLSIYSHIDDARENLSDLYEGVSF